MAGEITDSERNQDTADYIANVKEKATLRSEITEITKELNKTKGQNYDLLKKIEKLENENATLKKEHQTQNKRQKKKPAKRNTPRAKTKSSNDQNRHNQNDAFENNDTLYEEIAQRFPTMSLSTVLMAEHKFIEADVNGDGTVDVDELEKMLDSAKIMCTKAEVAEILKQIDGDGTNSLDFMECLEACDQLERKRHSKFSQSLQQNKSALCSIQ